MSDVKQQVEGDVIAEGLESGLQTFFPRSKELFIDLDQGRELNEDVLLLMLQSGVNLVSRLDTVSRSGFKHVYLLLEEAPVNDLERIALQAALGSDPKKEYLSTRQLKNGCTGYIALFETAVEAISVIAWRREHA